MRKRQSIAKKAEKLIQLQRLLLSLGYFQYILLNIDPNRKVWDNVGTVIYKYYEEWGTLDGCGLITLAEHKEIFHRYTLMSKPEATLPEGAPSGWIKNAKL
jgi:hypothetical protein